MNVDKLIETLGFTHIRDHTGLFFDLFIKNDNLLVIISDNDRFNVCYSEPNTVTEERIAENIVKFSEGQLMFSGKYQDMKGVGKVMIHLMNILHSETKLADKLANKCMDTPIEDLAISIWKEFCQQVERDLKGFITTKIVML